MIVIGDFISQVGDLGFERRLRACDKPLAYVAQQAGMLDGTMLENAFTCFKTQVQAIECGIPLFQLVDDPQALQIMFETTGPRRQFTHAGIELVLPGMSERRVSQVVSQRNSFCQIFVQAEVARERAGYLRHFDAMRKPCAKQISLVVDEDLRFVFKQAKRIAMNDTVPVALELAATCGRRFGVAAPASLVRVAGVRREGAHVGTWPCASAALSSTRRSAAGGTDSNVAR